MRFWKKKEEPKEFEPCLDTMIWLYKEHDIEDIAEIIEEGNYHAELCRVCCDNFVFDGQWCWYVPNENMHRVYQELVNGAKSIGHASERHSKPCCDTCYYEDGLGEDLENKEGSYIRHLCYEYGVWKEYGCEGDTDTCAHCAEKEGEEE